MDASLSFLLLLLLLLLPQRVAGDHQGHPDLSGQGAAAGSCRVQRQPPGLLLLRHQRDAAARQGGYT
jgi:hypothetical protein